MTGRPFRRVLIANRGEIAVRLSRTLRDLDIESVAVYSPEDRASAHVRLADYAFPLGGRGPQSYLQQERLLEVAREAQCDALLPGYGFLSENASFAQACADASLVFVGPSAQAIADMGDKVRARELMAKAGVPLVPGGAADTLAQAVATAARVGYPILLKAAGGGGGKGMRLVMAEAQLGSAYEQAKGEALRAFGSDIIYIEKAILNPRHVEIQVLGDQHGNVVHLFDRDCSIQRRHQKVIEESPSPNLSENTLNAMTAAALKAARAVNYYSVGTFEFLVDQNQDFYFLEMNTRLQVEHTVTELVTGIDLVEQMLLVAQGQRLAFSQQEIARRGFALECRVYAEDPSVGFLPSSGRVSQLRQPEGPYVRVDGCLFEGSEVSREFDPLLAKVCTWGDTRAQAIARMKRALAEFRLTGPRTNLSFHERAIRHPNFISGRYDTGFIAAHPELCQLEPLSEVTRGQVLAAACAATNAHNQVRTGGNRRQGQIHSSPGDESGAQGSAWISGRNNWTRTP
ncbi:MAG: hypothetical protein RJA70_2393 [Pseudomonadota bacterium]|jgi:acetyl-CoA carboxylase biotin carboxylase subunit